LKILQLKTSQERGERKDLAMGKMQDQTIREHSNEKRGGHYRKANKKPEKEG